MAKKYIQTKGPAGVVRFGGPSFWLKNYGALPGVAFKPYKPPNPAGYYDPALDTQRQAASRGLTYTQDDIGLAGTRAAEDYGIPDASGQIKDYSTVATINRARTNENDAYNRNVGLLTKSYTNLASRQADQANAYGVLPGGGAALQSAAKRAANQASDQAGLDLTHNQNLEALKVQGDQGLDIYNRGVTDRTTQGTRAGTEDTQFGLGITKEKAYQADQAGYVAPAPGTPGGRPLNETVLPGGKHVRTVTAGGYTYTYDQNGKVISKKKAPRVVTHTSGVTTP